jgi:hypothetical protein
MCACISMNMYVTARAQSRRRQLVGPVSEVNSEVVCRNLLNSRACVACLDRCPQSYTEQTWAEGGSISELVYACCFIPV